MNHYLKFSREIFYVTIVICLNILRLKAVSEITVGQRRTSLRKRDDSVQTCVSGCSWRTTPARSVSCRPLQSADGAPDTSPHRHSAGHHVTSPPPPETPRRSDVTASRTTAAAAENDDVIVALLALIGRRPLDNT